MFAVFSFIGMWLLFLTFYEQYPHFTADLQWQRSLYHPYFFGARDYLKDTVTLGCLGVATYATYQVPYRKETDCKVVLFFNSLALWIV